MSDLLYLIVFYVMRYRRNVVYGNLKHVFPEKSEKEIDQIARRFYRHFCDWIVEIIKSFSLSDKELARRVKLENDVSGEILENAKGTLIVGTHYGNNEWLLSRLDLMINRQFNAYAIFAPIKNKAMERMILRMRTRRGVVFIPMRKAMIQAIRKMKETCMFGFLTDQAPHKGQRQYFTNFLGQPTSWHISASRVALRTNSIVYLGDMRKVKRGFYTLKLIPLDPAPYLPENQESILKFTDAQIAVLEQAIREKPEYWLWSHRRWKMKPRETDYVAEGL